MHDVNLKAYPAPEGAKLSDDYTVKVNGTQVDVYRGEIYHQTMSPPFGGPYSFAYFDFSGTVELEVGSSKQWLRDVVIRPESKGVKPSHVYRGTMKFNLTDAPSYLSIEPDAKHGPLLLFANPLEKSAPSPNDANVKYFGPGIHRPGAIELTDNETLYIAGGAVVKGGIHAEGRNIKILGRGILDGIDHPWFQGPAKTIIDLDHCENVLVDGIIIKDGWGWNLNMRGCKDVTVRNFKLVALRCMNNDGIDICNTRDVLIEDSFIRSEDDCIAIKGFGFADRQAVDNVLVRRTSLWNDRAHVWRIGCECRAEAMRNITFKDIDVLHYVTNYWNGDDLPTCVSLQPAEDMPLENVLFEDIRINHEGQEWVFEIMPKVTQWAEKKTFGTIRNCTFRNISLTGSFQGNYGKIKVHGPDPEHTVVNVLFENVVRHGEITKQDSPSVEVSGHAKDIVFK
ncbi:MAG TPA: hypothetical protein DCZ94_12035 [Lentisphaeria bacterium]|nr:MAG: hypothetical protein A2X48_09370 [Lentisphaerae bacterium GWF2_49_21]HBC87678.1 hypothetical protein [Lentisphaeria bacterium]